MGTKRGSKGAVSIENIDNRIRLRWRYQSKRYSLNLFLFSKTNLIQAKKVAASIEKDMVFECFDVTLKKYKPEQKQEPICRKTLVEHFEYWVKNYRNMDCEKDIDYHSSRNMIKKWGDIDYNLVLTRFNKETFGAKTYNRRLTLLQAFFKWAKKGKIYPENPLEDVLRKKVKKTANENRKPFTEEEIRKILTAIKDDTFCPKSSRYKDSHYYPFLYFVFATGVRPAEAIGLRVKNVSLTEKRIAITEVLARTIKGTNPSQRVRKETKNGKHRVIPLSEDLSDVLLALIEAKKSDDLVFTSHTGLAIDDVMFQRRILRRVLNKLEIPHRVLYACRHTFNSRCIQSGMTPVMAAFLMGNNPETALRNYTHLIELPQELPKIN